jgi:hypothetical protein
LSSRQIIAVGGDINCVSGRASLKSRMARAEIRENVPRSLAWPEAVELIFKGLNGAMGSGASRN